MPSTCPELIFVAGPQQGERAVLMSPVVGVGRSPDADVQLSELYVSRRQLQFAITHEGWIVENVAKKSRVRINGKKLKVGKKLILDTGDLLSVETFTIRTSEGEALVFQPADGATFHTGPLSHIRDHLLSGTPVRVRYLEQSGLLVAVAVTDR